MNPTKLEHPVLEPPTVRASGDESTKIGHPVLEPPIVRASRDESTKIGASGAGAANI